MTTREIVGAVGSIPLFFLAMLMFNYVMTQGTPKNMLPDMVFVNIMIVGGFIVIMKTFVRSTSKVEKTIDYSTL